MKSTLIILITLFSLHLFCNAQDIDKEVILKNRVKCVKMIGMDTVLLTSEYNRNGDLIRVTGRSYIDEKGRKFQANTSYNYKGQLLESKIAYAEYTGLFLSHDTTYYFYDNSQRIQFELNSKELKESLYENTNSKRIWKEKIYNSDTSHPYAKDSVIFINHKNFYLRYYSLYSINGSKSVYKTFFNACRIDPVEYRFIKEFCKSSTNTDTTLFFGDTLKQTLFLEPWYTKKDLNFIDKYENPDRSLLLSSNISKIVTEKFKNGKIANRIITTITRIFENPTQISTTKDSYFDTGLIKERNELILYDNPELSQSKCTFEYEYY